MWSTYVRRTVDLLGSSGHAAQDRGGAYLQCMDYKSEYADVKRIVIRESQVSRCSPVCVKD